MENHSQSIDFIGFYCVFCPVDKLCKIKGQNVDNLDAQPAQRQKFVAKVKKIENHHIFAIFDFSTKSCGKHKFPLSFPHSDNFLSLKILNRLKIQKFSTPKKANKINTSRDFVHAKSPCFPHNLNNCGKSVEIQNIFPHFHNLFITSRRKIVGEVR